MESIGQILKAARERRQMTISDVVAATKMTSTFVHAIEADNFGTLVAPIYARGFIKLYAECVRMDPAPLLKQFGAAGQAMPAQPRSHPPARTLQALSKAPLMKAQVDHASKPKPPRLQQSGPLPHHGATGKPAPISKPPLSWPTFLPTRRWPAVNWTFISRIQWPRFKLPSRMFPYFPLPVVVWRRIFIITGVALLIIAASLAWEWSRRGMPSMTDACRWLAEPPAPYLAAEARPASPVK